VFLDVFDDVFLLHLPLETAQGALDGFAFLNLYFCQAQHPLPLEIFGSSGANLEPGPTR
jgi:hypothetical protein